MAMKQVRFARAVNLVLWGLVSLFVSLLVSAGSAGAAVFHVRTSGTLAGGPSTPSIWLPENCYPTLAAALASAAAQDTVLLYPETHVLDEPVTLTALLTNRYLEYEPGATEVQVGTNGTFTVPTTLAGTEVRAVNFLGNGVPRTPAAFTVANPDSLVQSVLFARCRFENLRGAQRTGGSAGSAIAALTPGVDANLTLEHCTFVGNQTSGNGGALWVGGGYQLQILSCTFEQNAAVGNGKGGAMAIAGNSVPTVVTCEDTDILDSSSAGPAGAIDIDSSSFTMRRCNLNGSRSGTVPSLNWCGGAGIRVHRDAGHMLPVSFTAENCEFHDNRGLMDHGSQAGDGGAVIIKGDLDRLVDVTVTGCLFQDNYNAQGAGLYIGRYAVGHVVDCRFIDNAAWYQGGGSMKGGALVTNQGELATYDYCEFRGNRAGVRPDGTETLEYSRGGGMIVRHYPRAIMRNCTFVDNRVNSASYAIGDGFCSALEGGGWEPDQLCSLINCAFWGTGNDVQIHSEFGGMAQISNVAVASDQIIAPDVTWENMVTLTASPFVGGLDLHPLTGAPIIDAGLDLGLTQDLDGQAVPFGGAPDIGCFEWVAPTAIGAREVPAIPSLTSFPNPFNPHTTVRCRLAAPAAVRLRIYDPRGHEVAALYRGDLPAGDHAWIWDGTDEAGRGVATGVYLARLEVAGQPTVNTKLVLVR